MTVNVYAIATQPNNFSQVSNPCSKINILTDQLKIEFKFPMKVVTGGESERVLNALRSRSI